MQSVLRVDLTKNIATVPLHKGTYNGSTVWYVLMDVSDANLARDLGLNFAPRLINADNGCPACVQTVQSADQVLGRAEVAFAGTVDFSPSRVLMPSATGFPPLMAAPGSLAGRGYSDLVRVAGSSVVYNAPIIATGDGPFDVTTHTDTLDRVIAIDTQAMTVDLQFIRAFSHGKDIFYFTFSSTAALSATLERGTFVPAMATLPFANDDQNPAGARCAIFTFANGKRGATSPPAQGLMHVILDNPAGDLSLENNALLESLARGGDAHNVLGCFPTLRDQHLRELYSPLWDLNIAVWSPDAVASGQNTTQTDANQIRQLAARGIVTSPGGGLLGSSNFTVNCPTLGFADTPPLEDQAPRPPMAVIPQAVLPADNATMFPQTGVSVGATLLSYWRTNGGLPIFGYPIAPAQSVNGRVVQWFERHRLEMHPENPVPYNVMLGRVGVEALEHQGRDWQTSPKAAAGAQHYFTPTGHAIAPEFWSYWQSHGLQLDGKRSVSAAESIALFGYPISLPQMEQGADGKMYLTQWFERARFEYHPNAAAPGRVQLGRVGAELK
ncbi:MAG: hypothetical protein ABIV47_09375 [Roseiflexaceae bacterium]